MHPPVLLGKKLALGQSLDLDDARRLACLVDDGVDFGKSVHVSHGTSPVPSFAMMIGLGNGANLGGPADSERDQHAEGLAD